MIKQDESPKRKEESLHSPYPGIEALYPRHRGDPGSGRRVPWRKRGLSVAGWGNLVLLRNNEIDSCFGNLVASDFVKPRVAQGRLKAQMNQNIFKLKSGAVCHKLLRLGLVSLRQKITARKCMAVGSSNLSGSCGET